VPSPSSRRIPLDFCTPAYSFSSPADVRVCLLRRHRVPTSVITIEALPGPCTCSTLASANDVSPSSSTAPLLDPYPPSHRRHRLSGAPFRAKKPENIEPHSNLAGITELRTEISASHRTDTLSRKFHGLSSSSPCLQYSHLSPLSVCVSSCP